MKTKEDILRMLKVMEVNSDIDSTVTHQRWELLIEGIIDIRDILDKKMQYPKTHLEQILDKGFL